MMIAHASLNSEASRTPANHCAKDATMTETTISADFDEDTAAELSLASDATDDQEVPQTSVSRSVADDIAKFEASFRDLSKRYRLIDRIGEGKRPANAKSFID